MSGLSIGIGVGLRYATPPFGKIIVPTPLPSPIASYRCYDKTNEDEDRSVLRDLTGNGHDIQLYNFAFTEESGYNKSTYNGALVSDGVDDYGFCENFPILTKENGYTVCAIRRILSNKNGYVFSNASSTGGEDGFCQFERGDKDTTKNYGADNNIIIKPMLFSYQNSLKYNGVSIKQGDRNANDKFVIFCHDYASKTLYVTSIALYALEIYDRDLTDEEIAKVKERMIAEYEAKTGNKYTEENT